MRGRSVRNLGARNNLMFAGKPIIGLVGGIGSGKSYVAGLLGEMGCLVIDSDQQVGEVYQDPAVLGRLKQWWGDGVVDAGGRLDRAAVAKVVFADPTERKRLEDLIHPLVDQKRRELMDRMANDPAVRAYVWDTPLLVEKGLDKQCDALVFVEAPDSQRLDRVKKSRGWSEQEWVRREKLQLPLDKKRELAKYTVRNTAGAGSDTSVRTQLRDILSRIWSGMSDG
jgi:dephospho-CoA kinase